MRRLFVRNGDPLALALYIFIFISLRSLVHTRGWIKAGKQCEEIKALAF